MTLPRWPALLALALLFGPLSFPVQADEAPAAPANLPKPADVLALSGSPEKVTLIGMDDARQLILTATLAGNRLQDLSAAVTYDVADPKVVRVTSTGRVLPLANGTTTITARFGDKTVVLPVTADSCDVNLPINFPNQIVPIFTKLGCNSGGCHGKQAGQNGFRLSLLGFEPELDFMTLVKEGRGRRLFPAAPDNSLLLLKSVGAVAHGGGKRMEVGSDEYKLVRRWIAAGMPYGKESDPKVIRITVFPDHRVLTRQDRQQISVFAHYSDGVIQDITRRAQYESNDQEIATVDTNGAVYTLAMSGEAAIMVRYQDQVTVFRGTVPVGGNTPAYTFDPHTPVDQYTAAKWQQLGLVPSAACSDEQFLRRLMIDLTGTLPTPKQIAAFVGDKDSSKRDKLVDTLLESPEYSYFFANKWADVLRVKRRGQPDRARGTFAFHGWIRDAIASDKPYNEFAREILTATGDEINSAPTVWYKELVNPEQFVDDTAQVFLGLRMACAQCHHHPYERWSQDDYWGLAAYFGRIGRKTAMVPGAANQQDQLLTIYTKSAGNVVNKKTGQTAIMKPLDGAAVVLSTDDDPRLKLADWVTDTKNPFFAKAVANRYWAHFFGRGIVDPLDDMRVTNPPSNPELLDALAKELVEHNYSLKHLVRIICKSRTYQLSAVPNDFNKQDKQNYARYYPRRLSAEVLYDAVNQVAGTPAVFNGMPHDLHAPNRAIMLPDESFPSYFLDVFGRPQRISACECERVSEANLAQSLHLLNSDEIQGKLTAGNGRADMLAKDLRPEADKVDELFLWALSRKPSPEQREAALGHIGKHISKQSFIWLAGPAAMQTRLAVDKKVAYENILWALLNTKEFVFNQ